jgi:ankyrin repeat protein
MSPRAAAVTAAFIMACGVRGRAQEPGRVEFVRDVQPIFRTHCVGCHGPAVHQNGFRLDRRGDAMRGGTIAVIGPGNAEGSRLYHRLRGGDFGPQMPPTGALRPEQIAVIKAWIDQGAVWPDEASGETPLAPPDPRATRMADALRAGNRSAFRADAGAGPVAGLKAQGGITPLMQAALYGSVDDMRLLLDTGAEVDARSDAGATALMWATHDIAKVRLLLDHGANLNAASDHGRTPLMVAAGRAGAAPVVTLLLQRGANPSSKGADSATLAEASLVGDLVVTRALIDAGADVAAAGPATPMLALKAGCVPCAELLVAKLPKPLLDAAATLAGPPLGDSRQMPFFVERGADVNARDPQGRTLLMLAAASDEVPAGIVSALIARGADVSAQTPDGDTAVSIARRRHNGPVVALLEKAGARAEAAKAVTAGGASPRAAAPASSPRDAVARSLPLLQRSDVTFLKKSGCVSCHNNTITAMSVAAARAKGVAVDETIARQQRTAIGTYMDSWRDRLLEGMGIPGDNDTVSYILLGLAAEAYPADAATDAAAFYLVRQQMADGRFRILAHRPPIESSDFEVTALTMRALQLYAPQSNRRAFDGVIRRASAWLQRSTPTTTEDRVFQLLASGWSGAPESAKQSAARSLLAGQRPDGGWSQLPSLDSDAYATGQALYALAESGALSVNDPAYARGVGFLLSTQHADGSWYVASRAIALQPHFDAEFPYGREQFISAAATNWATLALTESIGKAR